LYAEHVISLLVRNVTRVTLLKTLVKKKVVAEARSVMGSEPFTLSYRLEVIPVNVWHVKYPVILHSPVRASL